VSSGWGAAGGPAPCPVDKGGEAPSAEVTVGGMTRVAVAPGAADRATVAVAADAAEAWDAVERGRGGVIVGCDPATSTIGVRVGMKVWEGTGWAFGWAWKRERSSRSAWTDDGAIIASALWVQ